MSTALDGSWVEGVPGVSKELEESVEEIVPDVHSGFAHAVFVVEVDCVSGLAVEFLPAGFVTARDSGLKATLALSVEEEDSEGLVVQEPGGEGVKAGGTQIRHAVVVSQFVVELP